MKNKVMLITYPDCMGNNLKDLKRMLDMYFAEAISGVHILPFFPSSGDRGCAPINYKQVEPDFGDWGDIKELAKDYELMFDFMVNHISARSSYYQDFLEKKDNSLYADLFIRYKNFWTNGNPSKTQENKIYKRKEKAPYTIAHFQDGSCEKVWCTFSEEQIDLNVSSQIGKKYLEENIQGLIEKGASLIRLDAFAYAVKKEDTNCFFVEPEIWELLSECQRMAREKGSDILPEIHEHYSIALKLAERGYWVYDFALPMLVLHALYFGITKYLKHWLEICPRNQYTTLDTHDGIGVVDVRGLLPDTEIERTREHLFQYGANVKRIYSTEKYNNLDIYQINCTYYSALGDDDAAYLLARVTQLFAPGIPQIYYVGLLAGKNDTKLLEETKEGRNINRHYYTTEELGREVERPVVKKLLKLMKLRNNEDAFNGKFSLEEPKGGHLDLCWSTEKEKISLRADYERKEFSIIKETGTAFSILFNSEEEKYKEL